MRSSLLGLLALLLGCGDRAAARSTAGTAAAPAAKDPYADSPLVGRWSGDSRTIEFIADGTLVDLVWFDAERSTRQDDGTFEAETVQHFECHAGSFRVDSDRVAYDLVEVGSDAHLEGAWTWSVEETTLSLDEEGVREEFLRDDAEVSPAAQPLLGLWRRAGKMSTDYADLGLRFTPGGLAIVVGKCSRGVGGNVSSIGWLCTFATYEVEDETLHDVRPDDPDRARSRTFKIEGDKLTFGPMRVYERVRGVVPLDGSKLDLAAWQAMK